MQDYSILMEKLKQKLIKSGESKEYICNIFKIPTEEELKNLTDLYETFVSNNTVYEKDEMEELKNYMIPEKIINFYKKYSPSEGINLGADVSLLSIENIKRENTELAPGALLIKYGILTFASTTGGNAICMDLNIINNREPKIIIADYSIFNGKNILVYKNGVREKLKLSYEVISRYTIEVSDTFTEFLQMIIDDEIEDIENFLD